MLFTAVKGRKANASIQPQKTAPAPPVGRRCHAPPRAIIFLLFVLPLAGLRAERVQGCQARTGGPVAGPRGPACLLETGSAAVAAAVELWWLIEANAC